MAKVDLAQLLADLEAQGIVRSMTEESYPLIVERCRFNGGTLPLAIVACDLLSEGAPMTLRGLFYRVVSAGWLPDTGAKHYARLGRIMTILRERRVIPFAWLVDNIRDTDKPSSWSGLADFTETVRSAYRLDFWASLAEYVHIIVEKDAMAGTLAPVTREYDVSLSVVRGYTSVSFAAQIAEQWDQIEKPIYAYYLGDHDPSGLDIERDLEAKLRRYCQRGFEWRRLAVLPDDFERFDLLRLPLKAKDRRRLAFIEAGYTEAAELDAIPAPALRERLTEAIVANIPADKWERLRVVEEAERQSWHEVIERMNGAAA